MNARSFHYLCGLTVLVTHVVAIALIANATRFTDIRDQIGSILIVAPITLVYASAFIRYVVNNTAPSNGSASPELFDKLAAGTMYFVVLVFCASLFYVVVKFVYLSSYPTNEFKMWLGAAETAFGALIGIVFEKLFGVQPTPFKTDQAQPAALSPPTGIRPQE